MSTYGNVRAEKGATLRQPHLWPGTLGPSDTTPPRQPGSVRRTSSVDMLRPEGPTGPLVLRGRARDIRTRADGGADILARASTELRIDYAGTRTVLDLATEPPVPGAAELVGARAGSGFRGRLHGVASALAGSLVYLLLDEVPVVTLISRAALSENGVREPGGGMSLTVVDVCAGWVDGGHLARSLHLDGSLPPIVRPGAPDLSVPGDALAWHEQPDLPPTGMRRLRRIDVVPLDAGDGATWHIDSMFRDSLVEPVNGHTVVHEYSVVAVVRRTSGRIVDIDVTARVLPGPECPNAVASAGRVVGRRAGELRSLVSGQFSGVTTCTHLNDQLRALGDVDALFEVAG